MFKRALFIVPLVVGMTSIAYAAPTLTAADYKLVMDTYQQCKTSGERQSYDCDCLAVTYLDQVQHLRTKMERSNEDNTAITYAITIQHDNMMRTAHKACMDFDRAAAFNYGQCLSMNKMTRDNADQFCGCYALDYTDRMVNTYTDDYIDPATLMSRSIIACNKRYPK